MSRNNIPTNQPPTGHYIGELINGSGLIVVNVPCGTMVRIDVEFTNLGSSLAMIHMQNGTIITLSPGQVKGISLLLLSKSYTLCSSIANGSLVEVIQGGAVQGMVGNAYVNAVIIRISGNVFVYITYWVIRL
ncbi:hypothetical protein [Vulcanisaeta sp. JCM 16161]|uniref:hypothetical protein n=1 Tax=Vulcanisaeta sp. JCM 16161 TaxID=1295372 RepID=UPI001FB2936E|nr:hypothetical protein [Vulcanisaeta sp. JCM 16161]